MTHGTVNSSPRRAFFHEATVRLVATLADYLEKRVRLRRIPEFRARLRPPGAIEESRLIETCYRCGACVDICPADAIFPLDKTEGEAVGTPAIDPDRAACVVCDGLKCTTVCPSGALLPLIDVRDIRMGVAEVYDPLCVRTRSEACTLCVDRCPVGERAIRFTDPPKADPPEVLSPGCVGCGVCQFYCPTSPKAIVVKPL